MTKNKQNKTKNLDCTKKLSTCITRVVSDVQKLLHINKKKTNNTKEKWAKFMHRQFTEEEMKKAEKHKKRCSTLQVVRET